MEKTDCPLFSYQTILLYYKFILTVAWQITDVMDHYFWIICCDAYQNVLENHLRRKRFKKCICESGIVWVEIIPYTVSVEIVGHGLWHRDFDKLTSEMDRHWRKIFARRQQKEATFLCSSQYQWLFCQFIHWSFPKIIPNATNLNLKIYFQKQESFKWSKN